MVGRAPPHRNGPVCPARRYDSAQRLLGLLAVTKDTPVENRRLADAIIRIFAVRAAAELERARSEGERNRLGSAVEQAAESIMITKLDGTIVYVNPAFERATGYGVLDVLGRGRHGHRKAVAPETKIIMVSGLSSIELARETLSRGAVDFVVKPIDLAYLGRTVDTAITLKHLGT